MLHSLDARASATAKAVAGKAMQQMTLAPPPAPSSGGQAKKSPSSTASSGPTLKLHSPQSCWVDTKAVPASWPASQSPASKSPSQTAVSGKSRSPTGVAERHKHDRRHSDQHSPSNAAKQSPSHDKRHWQKHVTEMMHGTIQGTKSDLVLQMDALAENMKQQQTVQTSRMETQITTLTGEKRSLEARLEETNARFEQLAAKFELVLSATASDVRRRG